MLTYRQYSHISGLLFNAWHDMTYRFDVPRNERRAEQARLVECENIAIEQMQHIMFGR